MSHKLRTRATLAGLALAVLAVGCAPDQLTAPPATARAVTPSGSLLGGLLGTVTGVVGGVVNTVTSLLLPAVHRSKSLSTDVAVTQTIGIAGGTISIPQAGMRIVFSPGAVLQPTSITATANAGGYAAYSFEPHGIQFSAPVVVMQDASYLQTSGLLGGLGSVQGGYMSDGISDLDQSTGTVTVSEQLPATTSYMYFNGHWTNVTSYSIKHFSGYILTTGRQ